MKVEPTIFVLAFVLLFFPFNQSLHLFSSPKIMSGSAQTGPIQPIPGQYANFSLSVFSYNGTFVSSGYYNITYQQPDPSWENCINATRDLFLPIWGLISGWQLVNVSNRQIVDQSASFWSGATYYEFWMQLPLQIGENVTWWTTPWANATVLASEILNLMGREINCWKTCCNVSGISPDPKDLNQTAWFDKSTGHLVRMIEYENDRYLDISVFQTNIVVQTVHNLNTGLNYTAIQEAIDAPETLNGHTIFVKNGVYYEHLIVYKSVSLIGENRDMTIIDGNGTGTVIQITANNVSVINFTIRNAGKTWSGIGYPPSCISGNNVAYVNITNNVLTNAAVCTWFYSSTFINISNNSVTNAIAAGIIGYASSNIVINQNLVDNCGLMGLHLDGSSTGCDIINNTVMNTLEGIEVETSAGNYVVGNLLEGNNVSIVLNQCNGLNTFRENNMTSDWYNLIIWGWTLDAFMQDFDTTNIVNGKTVFYFTSAHNLLINPSNCPNIGYLAIVNCTNTTIKDIDLSLNKDGLILAQSSNCSLINITLDGNRGPLIYGGLTLFNSTNNKIVNSLISNNSVGICTYQSNGNIFYHNAFINNTIHLISNFYSPFQSPPQSAPYSNNIWDDGYPNGGNYWSNYAGVDFHNGPYQNETGSDGIGDSKFRINSGPGTPPELVQFDNYPLMGMFYDFEVAGPGNEIYHVQVISNSTVSELNLAVWLSSPNEYLQPGQEFLQFYVEGENDTSGFCRITISRALLNDSYIVLVDWTIVPSYQLDVSNSTHTYLYFTYNHTKHEVIIIPEFTFTSILLLFLTATLIEIILLRTKAKTSKTNLDISLKPRRTPTQIFSVSVY
ncbi:MAG: NosD domain-containing protein [Candidatus Bathyarchaeia archaeon]